MNAAHHLARQIIEGRDVELKGRKGDADGIGQMAPAAGAKAFRKTVLEIIELDLDGRLVALILQHRRRSPERPVSYDAYHWYAALRYVMRGLDPRIHQKIKAYLNDGWPGHLVQRRALHFCPAMTPDEIAPYLIKPFSL